MNDFEKSNKNISRRIFSMEAIIELLERLHLALKLLLGEDQNGDSEMVGSW